MEANYSHIAGVKLQQRGRRIKIFTNWQMNSSLLMNVHQYGSANVFLFFCTLKKDYVNVKPE